MEDFCLTIPYELFVLAGGIVGYVKRRSTASLSAGVGFGGLLLAAGFASLRAFQTHSISYLALTLETDLRFIVSGLVDDLLISDLCDPVCAVLLMVLMGWRFFKSRKVMPAGVVANLSAIMSGFYIYMMATRKHHFNSASSV